MSSFRAVRTRARAMARAHNITGTHDVVPASRWVYVTAVNRLLTRTRSVFPAVNSPALRLSTSAAAA